MACAMAAILGGNMDLATPHGAKVKYIGVSDEQVRYGGHDDPRGILKEGMSYTVATVRIRSWNSDVVLQEFPDNGFNTVCFENVWL